MRNKHMILPEPESTKEIIGQELPIKKILSTLSKWKKGKAFFLYGHTGTGKTAFVRALANEKNFELVELNASSKRTAEAIQAELSTATKQRSLLGKKKIILIDELDGLSKGDKGAIGSISKIIEESSFPVFLIAQKYWDKRFYELRGRCTPIEFKKINPFILQKRLEFLLKKDKKPINSFILRKIASNGDFRSALIDLETYTDGNLRESEINIFQTLRIIFKSASIKNSLEAINSSESDLETISSWIKENIVIEFSKKEEIAKAYDLLSRADIKRRSSSFKSALASVSATRERPDRSFKSYKSPLFLPKIRESLNPKVINS